MRAVLHGPAPVHGDGQGIARTSAVLHSDRIQIHRPQRRRAANLGIPGEDSLQVKYTKETKQKAIERMVRADKIMAEMKPITMHALSKRYRVCWKIMTRLERGEHVTPKHMTQEDIKQAVKDLRRYRELEAMHETREEIAKDLGIEYNNSILWGWMKEHRKHKAAAIEYDDVQVHFLTMPTVVSQPERGWYY